MLIRALTYRDEPLEVLIDKALERRPRRRDAHAPRGCGMIRSANRGRQQARACTRAPRPSSRRRPRRFESGVWLSRNGRRVNAKSIMGVMMLAAGMGSTVEIEAEGADEAGGDRGARDALRRQVRRGLRPMDAARAPSASPCTASASPAASPSATRTSSPACRPRSTTTRSPRARDPARAAPLRPRGEARCATS